MLFTADSSESVLRSGSFSLAISSTCLAVIVPDLGLVRLARSLRDVRGALQQHRGRRRLRDERVRPIRVDGHHRGDDEAVLGRGLGVEVLAEVHDVHAVRTERGADRRRGRRLARGNLQLHNRLNFFRQCSSTCLTNDFLDLKEVEFDRRRAPEDRDHHLQRVLVEVHLVHDAVEARERPLVDPHLLAALERVLRLRLLGRRAHLRRGSARPRPC